MKFEPGDIVRYYEGKVDWEVVRRVDMLRSDGKFYYILKSGMSGRRMTAWPNEVRPWKPGER